MSCSNSVSSVGLFPIAGLFPLPGYSYCGGISYAGLHSLNLFVSHSIHITSFGYIATLVLSVAILCVVWGILCLICFLFVSHLVPQLIFRRGILFRMKPQCCWVGISLMQEVNIKSHESLSSIYDLNTFNHSSYHISLLGLFCNVIVIMMSAERDSA